MPGHPSVTLHTGHQSLVKPANQTFRDRHAAIQIVRHKLKGLAVVQRLADIVRIRFRLCMAKHSAGTTLGAESPFLNPPITWCRKSSPASGSRR